MRMLYLNFQELNVQYVAFVTETETRKKFVELSCSKWSI